jgi:hypothetical protein
MKRKNLILVAILVLSALFTIQSCTKDESPTPVIYKAAVPAAPSPANEAVVDFTGTGQAINLTWGGDATSGSWDVYFGTDAKPSKVATVTSNAYSTTVTSGGTYYWYVVTVDANKVKSTSEIWSFEVNSNPDAPVLTAPADAATAVSKTVALKWTASDPEDDDLTFDVYVSASADGNPVVPTIVASGVTALTYSPTLAYATKYYWKVIAHDPYGGVSTSVTRSFTTDVQKPDFTVFNGSASEAALAPLSTTAQTVSIQRIGTSNVIAITLPLADNMVTAGWGTVYSGTHSIFVTYDPVTYVITSAKQAWCDSFIDPTEMGPMSLQVGAGSTIDGFNKKLKIKWVISGNAYWGPDYTTGTVTYTMK